MLVIWVGIGAACAAVAFWAICVEPNWYRLKRMRHYGEKKIRKPITILHLSDIHFQEKISSSNFGSLVEAKRSMSMSLVSRSNERVCRMFANRDQLILALLQERFDVVEFGHSLFFCRQSICFVLSLRGLDGFSQLSLLGGGCVTNVGFENFHQSIQLLGGHLWDHRGKTVFDVGRHVSGD